MRYFLLFLTFFANLAYGNSLPVSSKNHMIRIQIHNLSPQIFTADLLEDLNLFAQQPEPLTLLADCSVELVHSGVVPSSTTLAFIFKISCVQTEEQMASQLLTEEYIENNLIPIFHERIPLSFTPYFGPVPPIYTI